MVFIFASYYYEGVGMGRHQVDMDAEAHEHRCAGRTDVALFVRHPRWCSEKERSTAFLFVLFFNAANGKNQHSRAELLLTKFVH